MDRYIKKILLFILLFSMIFSLNYFRKERISTVLDRIMTERIEIIENTAYGELSYEKAKLYLKKIINDPLLQSDLAYLKELEHNPTELDKIKNVEIGEIQRYKVIENTVGIKASVFWTVEGLHGTYSEHSTYYFELVKYKNTYILCDYYPL